MAFEESFFKGEDFFTLVEGFFYFRESAIQKENRYRFILGFQKFHITQINILVAGSSFGWKNISSDWIFPKPGIKYMK